MSFNLNEEQLAAIDTIVERSKERGTKLSSISGPAGTGKTTIIKTLRQHLNDVAVVTPTNKAAKVLRDKGIEDAATLHKIFFTPETRDNDNGKKYVVFIPNYKMDVLAPGKRKHAQTIIVDESSMVQQWMVECLARMCNHLVLVGDGSQLPPVKDAETPRGFFNTLEYSATLEQVMRQDEDSRILEVATKFRDGTAPPLDLRILNQFAPHLVCPEDNFNELILGMEEGEQNWKIVTFTNQLRFSINNRVRRVLGFGEWVMPQQYERMVCNTNVNDNLINGTELVVDSVEFIGGEALFKLLADIKAENDVAAGVHAITEKLGELFNRIPEAIYPKVLYTSLDDGEPGECHLNLLDYIKSYYPQRKDILGCLLDLHVWLKSLKENNWSLPSLPEIVCTLDFSYAVTCHKAQGSEYEVVIIVDQRWIVAKMGDKDYLSSLLPEAQRLSGPEYAQRWIYTAVTRARTHLIVCGDNLW